MPVVRLLLLNLCFVAVIQLTSSQFTHDVGQGERGIDTRGRSEHVLSQILTDTSQLKAAVSQLQQDVADIKDRNLQICCPHAFTHVSSVNGCYKVVAERLDWSLAGLKCRSIHQDAHLLVIDNAQEQFAVGEMLNSTGAAGSYWTGAQRSDPTSETPFVWRLKAPKQSEQVELFMTYTNWPHGEPNFAGQGESCMHIVQLHVDDAWGWNDFPCNSTISSICELDLSA